MSRSLLHRYGQALLLALVLAIALSLRLFGQDWDQGTYLHPDERYIAMVSSGRVLMPELRDLGTIFSPSNSPINPRRDDDNGRPYSFAYGTLPLYVQKLTGWSLNLFSDRNWNSYRELSTVGRTLTALVDTLTVAFVFLIGRRLFGVAAGFIAATLYAFSVLAVQLAHFFTVDPWLTLFVTASIFFSIRFIDTPRLKWALAIGAAVGMAFATKASVPSLLFPVLFSFIWVFWKSDERRAIAGLAAAGGLTSLVFFTLFEPYALVRIAPFVEDIRTQSRIVRGINDIPFTRQFVGLTPGAYELRNMFAYTMGPGLLIGAVGGSVYAIWRTVSERSPQLAVPVIWLLAYLPIILTTEARFLRYTLPLFPVLAVFTAGALVWLIAHPRLRGVGQVATVVVLTSTVVWAIGFLTIYTHDHSRLTASDWIFENVAPGSVLSAESWDDPLPIRAVDSPRAQFEIRTLDMYGDRPPEEKVAYLHGALEDVDYVVLSSNRLVYSVDNLPWRYAVQNEFYRRLDAGQLGFQLVHEGLIKPELFGIQYDTRHADESFTVYDHPQVRIYQRVEHLSEEEFRDRMLWSLQQPWEPRRYPSEQWLMLDRPVEGINSNSGTDWNRLATGNGHMSAIFWLIAIEIVGLSVLPLACAVLGRTRDRGAFSARLIGIILVGWMVWFGASVDLWPATVWTALGVLLLVGLACWIPVLAAEQVRRKDLIPGREHYLSGLLVFGTVFAVFLLFRAMYPDFWQTYYGGEKPFEIAYLRAVAASSEFPPFDPWFADGVINYYYYGWHLFATVTKLSGVGITHGFQLAIATIAGLLVLQAVSLAGLLTRGKQRRIASGITVSGLAVAFFIAIAGNIDGLLQVFQHRLAVADEFDFWRSTRIIDYTINEFPYFSLIWADLHPHVMNLPHYVLLMTLLTAMVLAARDATSPSREMLAVGTIALTLGTISVTNSWDAPLAIGLTVGAFLYAGALRGGYRWLIDTGYGAIVVALSFAMFAPFYLGFYSVVDGVSVASSGSATGQLLAHWGVFFVLSAAVLAFMMLRTSTIGSSLTLLLATVTTFAATASVATIVQLVRGDLPEIVSMLVPLVLSMAIMGVTTMSVRMERLNPLILSLVVIGAGIAGVLIATRPAAAIPAALATAAFLHGLVHWRHPARSVPWLLIAAGAVTIAAVEVLFVADDLRNSPWERMNTVFKFYVQAWILLAAGSVILAVRYLRWSTIGADRRSLSSTVVISALCAAVITGAIYPLFGTPARLSTNMPSTPTELTLDGYAWMRDGWIYNGTGDVIEYGGDLAAIEWLNANVSGTPVILEASIGPYRGNGSRISSATGLPTVLGWDRHQRQQRYEPGISQRMRDVRLIYNDVDLDRKMEMLRGYNVRYVIVGDVERSWNTPDNTAVYASLEGLAAFDQLVGNGLTIVFDQGSTIIYEVDDFPRLAPAASQ